MTDTSDILDTLITVTSTIRDAAIDSAQDYLGTDDTATGQKAAATAALAHKIILNQRSSDKAKTDSSITVRSLDELVTDEMRRMVTDADDLSSSETSFHYDTDAPADTWY